MQWSADGGQSSRELVRQQYIFRPPGTTREVEDYGLALDGVMHVVLRIVPDITGAIRGQPRQHCVACHALHRRLLLPATHSLRSACSSDVACALRERQAGFMSIPASCTVIMV
ncbi:MAG TPA: hypothetical protein VI542_12610 [Candidatus Tectomicrobia bacterium]